MADRIMSDAEIKRRKKLQGQISRTTSTLGLTGLGMLGAGALATRKPGALKKLPKLKGMSSDTIREGGHKAKEHAKTVGVVSGGVGGVGGYNFAAYTNAESRKRQFKPVPPKPKKKEALVKNDMEPIYGEIGKAENWKPTPAKQFNAEEKRHRRNERAEVGLSTAGGLTVGAGSLHALQGVGEQGRALNMKPRPKKAPYGPLTRHDSNKIKDTKAALKAAGKTKVRTGGKLMAVGATGLAASEVIRRGRKSDSWKSYS